MSVPEARQQYAGTKGVNHSGRHIQHITGLHSSRFHGLKHGPHILRLDPPLKFGRVTSRRKTSHIPAPGLNVSRNPTFGLAKPCV